MLTIRRVRYQYNNPTSLPTTGAGHSVCSSTMKSSPGLQICASSPKCNQRPNTRHSMRKEKRKEARRARNYTVRSQSGGSGFFGSQSRDERLDDGGGGDASLCSRELLRRRDDTGERKIEAGYLARGEKVCDSDWGVLVFVGG